MEHMILPIPLHYTKWTVKTQDTQTCNLCLKTFLPDNIFYKCSLCYSYVLCPTCKDTDIKGPLNGHILMTCVYNRQRPHPHKLNYNIIDTDLFFIHIPKNAGTWFSINYLPSKQFFHNMHGGILGFSPKDRKKTVAIIRNPYDRMVSSYNFSILPSTYYHSFNNKETGTMPSYTKIKDLNFNEYVKDAVTRAASKTRDIQLMYEMPQLFFISINGKDIICPNLIRFEHLEQDIDNILHLPLKGKPMNKSARSKPWQEYYTSQKIADSVYELYKQDFIALGYPRFFVSPN